jgi:hypothetical protein
MVGPGRHGWNVVLQFGDERVESAVRTAERMGAEAVDDVATPLREVLNKAHSRRRDQGPWSSRQPRVTIVV